MPAKSIMIVSSGITIISAMIRVTARYLNASTALASSASICSRHLHRADLGADAGADASRHEESSGQRTCFADERDREPRGNHRLGAEALERGACVHRQHDADREARRENQRRGAVSELKDVPEDFARLVGRTRGFDDGATAERGDRADEFEQADRSGAGAIDERNRLHLHWSQLDRRTLGWMFNTGPSRWARSAAEKNAP